MGQLHRIVVALLVVTGMGPAVVAGESEGAKSEAGWTPLVKDKALSNWTATFNKAGVSKGDIWTVRDNGVLYAQAGAKGPLRTRQSYDNYVLELEWRWLGEDQTGNSGVLVHCGRPKAVAVWPRCVEPQLHHGSAGDAYLLGTEAQAPHAANEKDGIRVKRRPAVQEKQPGQWNHMRVRCVNDSVTIWVNGEKANHVTNVSDKKTGKAVTSGAIGLQAEGTPIEFRHVRVRSVEGS